MADRQARRVPGLLRPFGVVLAGSFLIWSVPKLIDTAAGARRWFACPLPWLGAPLGLAFTDGPTILGWVASLVLLCPGVGWGRGCSARSRQ